MFLHKIFNWNSPIKISQSFYTYIDRNSKPISIFPIPTMNPLIQLSKFDPFTNTIIKIF